MKTQLRKQPIKKFTLFTPRIRSRHPSHDVLRGSLKKMPFRSVVRLGSTTEKGLEDIQVSCNEAKAIRNSASKLLMKQCFSNGGVVTAPWWTTNGKVFFPNSIDQTPNPGIKDLPYPLIIKSHNGSRGRGNSKIENPEQLETFMKNNDMSNYIIEQYKNFVREYRLHVTREGCFYTCRKMLKRDTPEDKKFQRHDDNCVWILEENASFDKPSNWDAVVNDCVKALESLGLDVGAFDLKIQSAKDSKGNKRENPEWIVIESCSAPSFGEITSQRYSEEIPKILIRKAKEQGIIN